MHAERWHNKDKWHSSLEKYTTHFIERVVCERELETEQNCNVLTPTPMAITAFLSRYPVLHYRGPGGPASLGHVPHSSIFSPTGQSGVLRAPSAGCWFFLPHLISNWLNFLCTELYNSLTPTFFLWASQIALIQPIHGQGYILIFLGRMHLLFTQVHFLFWQPSWAGGQYTTKTHDVFFRILLPKVRSIHYTRMIAINVIRSTFKFVFFCFFSVISNTTTNIIIN